MPYLILDTAAEIGLAALGEGEELLAEAILPNTFQGSKTLLPEIVELFKKNSLQPHELDFVATGIGPGSYTGIRVSVITAKAFAYAHNLPLVGVCSLEAYIPPVEGKFAVLADAKIGGVYCLTGERIRKEIVLHPPELIPLEEISKRMIGFPLLVTPKGGRLSQRLFPLLLQEAAPSAASLLRSVWKKYKEKHFSLDTRLEILYLRKTQAEIEKSQP